MSQAGDTVNPKLEPFKLSADHEPGSSSGGPSEMPAGQRADAPARSVGNPEPRPAGLSAGLARTLLAIAVAEAALVLAHSFSTSFPFEPRVAYAIGFLVVSSSVVATACACRPLPRRALAFIVLPGAALWVVHAAACGPLFSAMLVTAALLLAGTLLGAVVGGTVEHPGQLLFVAIVSAAADLASVVDPSGPSAAIAQSPAALALFALPWPMLGTSALEPFLGVGDIVFTALYAAASRRHALSLRRTALALMLGYAGVMLLVLTLEMTIPALPLLGLAMVLAHPQARRPSPADRRRGFVLSAVVVAVVVALLLRR
jgi:hypothetical protein